MTRIHISIFNTTIGKGLERLFSKKGDYNALGHEYAKSAMYMDGARTQKTITLADRLTLPGKIIRAGKRIGIFGIFDASEMQMASYCQYLDKDKGLNLKLGDYLRRG